MRSIHQCCKGLSLVELLVSVVLSTIIFSGLLQIFSIIRKGILYQQGRAHIQESARIIPFLLKEGVQNSGNVGCTTLNGFISLHIQGVHEAKALGLLRDEPIKIISGAVLERHFFF